MFLELLGEIGLRAEDTLYILGDVLDRGPHPIRTLLMLMKMPNVVCLAGNHELMALDVPGVPHEGDHGHVHRGTG